MSRKKPALGLDPRVGTDFAKRACSTKEIERDDEAKIKSSRFKRKKARPNLLQSCKEISKLHEIRILHRIDDVRHPGVVAAARIVLVAAQGLEQVVLALAGEPGNVLAALKIRLVTEVAPILLGQRA